MRALGDAKLRCIEPLQLAERAKLVESMRLALSVALSAQSEARLRRRRSSRSFHELVRLATSDSLLAEERERRTMERSSCPMCMAQAPCSSNAKTEQSAQIQLNGMNVLKVFTFRSSWNIMYM